MKERTITAIWIIVVIGICVWNKFLLIPSIIIGGAIIMEIANNGKVANLWVVIVSLQALGIMWVNQMTRKEIFFLSLIIGLNDTMAYFGGRFLNFGWKRKLFPATSPKKTYAGLFYGLMFATIGAILFEYFFPIFGKIVKATIIGLTLAIFGVLGDFVESKFKRVNKIKDSGEGMWTEKILKGHGGFFDRFDAISMALWGWIILKLIL